MGGPPAINATAAGKPRKKASSACTSCRLRRTKCETEPGEAVCRFCHRNKLQCVFQNDDERKISSSKAHISALNERVHMLEDLLRQQPRRSESTSAAEPQTQAEGTTPPGHHAGTRNQTLSPTDGPAGGDDEAAAYCQSSAMNDRPPNSTLAVSPLERSSDGLSTHSSHMSLNSPNHRKPVVAQLVVTVDNVGRKGNVQDHVDGSTAEATGTVYESRSQRRQIDRLLEEVPQATDDYLLSLFFEHGNSMLPVVHEEAFYRDKAAGRTRWYNGFLHICILAMGLRYADRSRPDVMRLILPNRESTLHRGATYLVEYELQCRGGIPSVQALLLLGDLEAACGRDNTGWMYGGIAIRLCFDIGLNLLPTMDLASWEVESWRRALWACYLHDKYWSFYLARPTSMKRSDIVPIPMKEEAQDAKMTIFSNLIALMEMITTIADNVEESIKPWDDVAYLYVSGIYRKLKGWYARLPDSLRWTPQNIQGAPLSFFLLHQQYYSSLILLYRPFTHYEASQSSEKDMVMDQISAVSRAICLESAVEVARIFRECRPRFDMKLVYFSAVQHAGTAATALITGLNHIEDPAKRAEPLQCLYTLARALHDMSPIYQPAERMSTVLDHIFSKAGWTIPNESNHHPSELVSAAGPPLRSPAKRPAATVQEDQYAKRPRVSNKAPFGADTTTVAAANGCNNATSNPAAGPSTNAPNTQQGFSPFLDPALGMNLPQFDTYYGSHSQNPTPNHHSHQQPQNQRAQVEAEFQPNFRTDYVDTDWDMILGPRTAVPRRVGFLDLSSGFDQLFQ